MTFRPTPKRETASLILRAAAAALAGVASGCRSDAGPAGADAPAAKVGESRPEGEIHLGDERLRVLPFVAHDPMNDLRIRCLERVEREKEAGRTEATPCFDPEPRGREAMKVLRIDHREGLRAGQAIRMLAAADEAAHLVVERTGSFMQVLDLAYAARREGVARRDEVRVLSGSRAGHEALVEVLGGHLPGLRVEVVELGPDAAGTGAAGPDATGASP